MKHRKPTSCPICGCYWLAELGDRIECLSCGMAQCDSGLFVPICSTPLDDEAIKRNFNYPMTDEGYDRLMHDLGL